MRTVGHHCARLKGGQGIDDGHIRSIAGRISAQVSGKDKLSYYHDDQNKVRGHWGIAANIPPDASIR